MVTDKRNQQEPENDAQFRAVVKRLLETPPMHKTAAARKPTKRPAAKEPKP